MTPSCYSNLIDQDFLANIPASLDDFQIHTPSNQWRSIGLNIFFRPESLGTGTAGLVSYLSELYRLTHNQKILGYLDMATQKLDNQLAESSSYNFGFMNGAAGALLALDTANQWLKEPSRNFGIEAHVKRIAKKFCDSKFVGNGLLDGRAGGLLVLTQLYGRHRTAWLSELIVAFTTKILYDALPAAKGLSWEDTDAQSAGLARGNAGIVFVLSQIGVLFQNSAIQECARHALKYIEVDVTSRLKIRDQKQKHQFDQNEARPFLDPVHGLLSNYFLDYRLHGHPSSREKITHLLEQNEDIDQKICNDIWDQIGFYTLRREAQRANVDLYRSREIRPDLVWPSEKGDCGWFNGIAAQGYLQLMQKFPDCESPMFPLLVVEPAGYGRLPIDESVVSNLLTEKYSKHFSLFDTKSVQALGFQNGSPPIQGFGISGQAKLNNAGSIVRDLHLQFINRPAELVPTLGLPSPSELYQINERLIILATENGVRWMEGAPLDPTTFNEIFTVDFRTKNFEVSNPGIEALILYQFLNPCTLGHATDHVCTYLMQQNEETKNALFSICEGVEGESLEELLKAAISNLVNEYRAVSLIKVTSQ